MLEATTLETPVCRTQLEAALLRAIQPAALLPHLRHRTQPLLQLSALELLVELLALHAKGSSASAATADKVHLRDWRVSRQVDNALPVGAPPEVLAPGARRLRELLNGLYAQGFVSILTQVSIMTCDAMHLS